MYNGFLFMNELDLFSIVDEAFKEAQLGFKENEVPVGCVIFNDEKILTKSHNLCNLLNDPTMHAEVIAINNIKNNKNINFNELTILTTLEPCVMCFSMINLLKFKEIIFVVNDELYGFSKYIKKEKIFKNCKVLKLNYKENDIKNLMKEFFKAKR